MGSPNCERIKALGTHRQPCGAYVADMRACQLGVNSTQHAARNAHDTSFLHTGYRIHIRLLQHGGMIILEQAGE